jgi:predicted ATPase
LSLLSRCRPGVDDAQVDSSLSQSSHALSTPAPASSVATSRGVSLEFEPVSSAPSIRTPDERLRVFVSSTLEELAGERAAVREAIERLRLTPVLFELGARPHPPQDVYQGYLAKSDVFVGIYGERYGWIGPGMEISGLEDEYLRSAGKPRLLYVKMPAPAREPRLAAFIDRLMADATVSFKTFRDDAELKDFVENDLALLLTERFVSAAGGVVKSRPSRVPSALDEFVGRELELRALLDLLSGSARLITVTGPGGVGKTRLAVEAARQSVVHFRDGVQFVGLSSVAEPELVTAAILTTLELPADPSTPVKDALVDQLRDGELLVLLDNFEHVLDAAAEIGDILAACAGLRLLVTSRSALRLRGEHEFPVAPLPDPDAVRLFAERARRVSPGFELAGENEAPVGEICRHLEGLPLAIELAAARTRTLSAEAMLPHLERRLDFLTGGGRDYPKRQRTLSATIAWSFALLEPLEQRLLERASAFRGGWDLAAAAAACSDGADALAVLESLLEKSLIRQHLVGGQPRFTMLETIREYAADRLEASGDLTETGRRHARFDLNLVAGAGAGLRGSAQAASLELLELEDDNVRAALRRSLEHGELDSVAAAGWALMPYWWLRGAFDEGERWMNEALAGGGLSTVGRAEALLVSGCIAFWRADYGTAMPALEEARAIFASAGDEHRAVLADAPLGAARAGAGDPSAVEVLEQSRSVLAESGDEWGLMLALNGLCWALNMLQRDAPLALFEEARERVSAVGTRAELATALGNLSLRLALQGDVTGAKTLLAETLAIVRALRSPTGVAYYVEMTAHLAAREGDHAASVRLFSASGAIRAATGADVPLPVAKMREQAFAAAESALGGDALETARAEGATLDVYEAADDALAWLARADESPSADQTGGAVSARP